MSLDGVFLHCIKCELENYIIGAKVDKIYQPSGEELVLSLRTRGAGGKKLLLCARANSPRVGFTSVSYENPAKPPMLCMLLRKRLGGATVMGVRQNSCDRILMLDFSATNEMGDKESLTLVVEIMAQYSNVILVSEDSTIIDALKRVDYSKSSVRLVLPGVKYEFPPSQDKMNLFETPVDELCKRIASVSGKGLSGAIMSSVMGVSPVVAREIEALTEAYISSGVCTEKLQALEKVLEGIKENYVDGSSKYVLLKDKTGKPFEFSFLDICQYGSEAEVEVYDSASQLLDDYYGSRDSIERIKHRTADMRKLLGNVKERIAGKADKQRAELAACENREELRISAELINATLYRLEKGASYYDLENYYDENRLMRVKVDPALSPAQNSQKYFKEYKKTYTAEKKLREQLESGMAELEYIDSVIDALSRAETERDIQSIREELVSGGYIKNRGKEKVKKNGKAQNPKRVQALPPIEYETTDGFRVLVGRNNIQNDKLSMKTAKKTDMWLHTKDFPGSHVIIESRDGVVSDNAIEEAAVIAAVNSTAKDAHKVPVDYTLVKNLKKPVGARPGKVIFHENWTIYVTPDLNFAEARKKK